MRVLFVNPVPAETRKVYIGYSHGIGYLSAVAKRDGHETALATITDRGGALADAFKAFDPDVVAITATSAQWGLAAWAAGEAQRMLPETPVIGGGIHATVAPAEVIATPGVWAACRGEGDAAFPEILKRLEWGDWEESPGFWTRPQVMGGVGPTPIVAPGTKAAPHGEIIHNDPLPLVDLAGLPHPDRNIYDYQAILDRNHNNVGAEFLASRGCPFTCTYCINHVMTDLTAGAWARVRYRRPEDVVDEIEEVLRRYTGVRMLGFHDDIFGLDKRWLREFAEVYRSRVGLPFWANERVGTFDEDDVRVLKAAGCFRVHMGIESADDTLRREVLGRDISSEEIEEAFAMLRRHGIRTVAFNMIGIPYETEETLEATIDLNRRIRPDWLVVSIFSPFPGTRLAEVAREKGWLREELPESYYDSAWALEQPSISRERLVWYYEHFVEMVYDKAARGTR